MITICNTNQKHMTQSKDNSLHSKNSNPLVKHNNFYFNIETEEALKSVNEKEAKCYYKFRSKNMDDNQSDNKCFTCNDPFSNHVFIGQKLSNDYLKNKKSLHTPASSDNHDFYSDSKNDNDNDNYDNNHNDSDNDDADNHNDKDDDDCNSVNNDDILSLSKREIQSKKSLPAIKSPTKSLIISRYCNICLDNNTDLKTIPCRHKFCKECIKMHLHEKINHRVIDTIPCPEKDCAFIFDESLIYQFITEEYKNKYQCFKRRNEIDKIPNAKYCPFPNCDSYALLPSTAPKETLVNKPNDLTNPIVIQIKKTTNENNNDNHPIDKNIDHGDIVLTCKDNNHRFCNKCNQKEHPGLKCDMKIEKDFVAWKKSANTRKCPSCNTDIEKNGGCNHMTCTKVDCGYHFCWICMGYCSSSHYENPLSPCFGLGFSDIPKCRILIVCLKYIGQILLFFIALALLFGWPGLPLMIIPSIIIYDEIEYKVRGLLPWIIYFLTCSFLSIALIPFGYICLAGIIAALPIALFVGGIYLVVEY